MISVVIPAYNEEKYIEKCLQSLMEQEVMPDEIIVVNNNSTDRTEEIVKRFPVILLTETKKGIIPARNKGFNAAKGTIIARTDADTIVPPDWIKKIKAHFEDRKLVALSGPANFYPLPEVMQLYNWQTVGINQSFKQIVGHDCMFGFNMSVRRSAWERVKEDVCRDDKEVHEDIDLSIHLAPIGKIKFDNGLVVKSSSRRLKKLDSYFEYPYRGLKSIAKHSKLVLHERKQSVQKFVASIKFHNLF
jgi:glycosyltransferase involved in cell wall biosynthesis